MTRGAVLLALGLGASAALAHALDHPKRVELRIDRAALVVAIDFQLAAGAPSQELRAAFDRDRSGALDPGEQEKLLRHLARLAALRTRADLDGTPLALAPLPGSLRGENLDHPVSSTSLLAVRLELQAPLPPGKPDWRGRRTLTFTDDAPDQTGHVPVRVICKACEIADSSSGTFAHDPGGDQVLGAETSPAAPLVLRLHLQ